MLTCVDHVSLSGGGNVRGRSVVKRIIPSLTVLVVMAAVMLSAPASAPAAQVIDQYQGYYSFSIPASSGPSDGQSFVFGAYNFSYPDNISGAGILLHANGSGSGLVTIELWNDVPGNPGAQLLRSGSVTGDAGTTGAWADVFWTPLPATGGDGYFLAFKAPSYMHIAYGGSSSYSLGYAFANGFQLQPQFDYSFRTFTDTSFVPTVPEPVGATMLTAGAVHLSRRRRHPDTL